ncbi:MAG TPA: right-handed parallel beta-helix repeat-containing protein [Chloroflexota bacterium]|jgi:hypothetical protein|nr:right-handed parallel beta-helix repeat-containing protein [Chloroflexota bacterium]
MGGQIATAAESNSAREVNVRQSGNVVRMPGAARRRFWLLRLALGVCVLASATVGVFSTPQIPAFAAGCPQSEAAIANLINSVSSGGTVRLSCALATTISFSPNSTGSTGIRGTGTMTVGDNVTLDASSSLGAIDLDGNGDTQLFDVKAGGAFGLTRLTLSGGAAGNGGAVTNAGTLHVTNSSFTSDGAQYDGGAIYSAGTATVISSTFSDNTASGNGGAIGNEGTMVVTGSTFSGNRAENSGNTPQGFSAGAIFSTGHLSITNTTFSNNVSSRGGAIVASGTLSVVQSTFSDNFADGTYLGFGDGGAILADGSTVVNSSTFSDNGAHGVGNQRFAYGGAIAAHGSLQVTSSTFTGNESQAGGGAAAFGGAISSVGTGLSVSNSTFSDNAVNGAGGAIYAYDSGTVSVTNSTLASNLSTIGKGGAFQNNDVKGGSLTILGDIFAANTPGVNCSYVGNGATIDEGYDLSDDNSCFAASKYGDILVSPAGVGLAPSLAWNGGPTQTIALLAGSPAIGAIPKYRPPNPFPLDICPASGLDQRGYDRHWSSCDIGAFETGGRSDLGDLPNREPGIANLRPNAIRAGSVIAPNTLVLDVSGRGFGSSQGIGSVSVNGSSAGVTVTAWTDTDVRVSVPASDLSSPGVDEVQVKAGRVSSNPEPLYVTPAAVAVSAYTSNDNAGDDTASVGGTGQGASGTISALLTGGSSDSAIQIAQFTGNPSMATPPDPQAYFDVHLMGSASTVTVRDCTPGDSSLDWYNGVGWQQIQPASAVKIVFLPSHQGVCRAATLSSSTTPSVSQLGGTELAGSTLPMAGFISGAHIKRKGGGVWAHWRLAPTHGVVGFNVYAGQHKLNPRLIPVHKSETYAFSRKWSGSGPFRLGIVFHGGAELVVAL